MKVVEATPEAGDRLAAALDGRVAGPAVDCVRRQDVRGQRIIDERTIVFGSGSTVYLNRTRGQCDGMREYNAIRMQSSGSRMCDGELITIFDPTSGTHYGACALGDFVPYRRRG